MTAHNIVLIGFMGAGKTSVAKGLNEYYGYRFLDTDDCLEQQQGMTVSEIFAGLGEERFRKLETELLQTLIGGCVQMAVSTGGGIAMREENRELLRKLGIVIYLQADARTVLERLQDDHSRPLLQVSDRETKIKEMIENRHGLYAAAADFIIPVTGKTIVEIVEEIRRTVVR